MSFLPELFDNTASHIHFVGIGGINMSALAEMMLEHGYTVSGSDLSETPLIRRLRRKGAQIYIGHDQINVTNADILVHTAAVDLTNPELQYAQQKNLPIISRAQLLGSVMNHYPNSIGISGTHGKTTTSSMLSVIMNTAELNPTIMIGGSLDAIGGNYQSGGSLFFIAEACEYQESFLAFRPHVAVLLNIELDHPDYYRDLNHIFDAFKRFAESVPSGGTVIGCGDDSLVQSILASLKCHTLSYSIHEMGNINATNIRYNTQGCSSFDCVSLSGQLLETITLQVPGLHNIYNALAAATTAACFNIPFSIIKEGLSAFRGAKRRFEIKGTYRGCIIIDDYAHHPTEIRAALKAACGFPHQRILCVFQPHTYSRTISLFDDFTGSFHLADIIFITDIYPAREKDTKSVHAKDLSNAIKNNGQCCNYASSFLELSSILDQMLEPGDLLITLGAGDVYRIGEMLLK